MHTTLALRGFSPNPPHGILMGVQNFGMDSYSVTRRQFAAI